MTYSIHDQIMHLTFDGGLHGRMRWQVDPIVHGTLVTVDVNYVVPPPLLRRHTHENIVRTNQHSLEAMLQALKRTFEPTPAGR